MLMSKNVNNDITMNASTPLRQHIKLVYNVCLSVFVVLNAFEGRQVHKSNYCTAYLHIFCQLF